MYIYKNMIDLSYNPSYLPVYDGTYAMYTLDHVIYSMPPCVYGAPVILIMHICVLINGFALLDAYILMYINIDDWYFVSIVNVK